MAFYDSTEVLSRWLSISKWIAIVFGVIFAFAAIFNQWASDRIGYLKDKKNSELQSGLRKVAEDAQKDAVNAKKSAKSAEDRAAKLEEKVKPRAITDEQREILKTEFDAAATRGEATAAIIFSSAMLDSESEQFSNQIRDAVKLGRWDVHSNIMGTVTFQGIRIVSYEKETEQAAATIERIFTKAKIDFSTETIPIERSPDQYKQAVYIWVGKKDI